MRLEIVRQVFIKELRETLRDRRSLAVMFGIPLLLYPLLTMAMAGVTSSTIRRMSRQTVRVAVVNGADAPRLLEQMQRTDSGVRVVTSPEPHDDLTANRIDAILTVPPGAQREAIASQEVRFRVEIDRSRTAARFTENRLDRLLSEFEKWIIEQRLRERGVPLTVMRPVKTATEDVSTGERRFGTMLSVMLPMLLLMTGTLGAFFPAINATTSERELGTLETLLVTPATKLELLLAKGALVLLSGLLTSGLNMLSMSLVLWRTFSMMGRNTGPLEINPGALALAYLAAVPAILFFSAAVMIVGLFARNYREANSYAAPVTLLPMVPLLASMAEPKTTPALLVTPILNTTLVIRDVLSGHASAGHFLLAFGSSILYAGLLLSVAARVFNSEQLVNPAWEPLSAKGLRRGSRPRERRLPAVDEALALFAVSLLLTFYVSPEWLKSGLLTALAGNELLLIAAPTLLFAWLGRYRWRETFSWRRADPRAFAGAALMAVGTIPWVLLLVGLQNQVWPPDPAVSRAMERLFRPALEQNPVVTVLAVGLLAGTCEELLYRGPLHSALTRRLPAWSALLIGAFLFAVAHMDAHGILPRTLLGMSLGWIVLRSGSIFPAMLMHATYDATALALSVWGRPGTALDPELASKLGAGTAGPLLLQLGVATALLLVGWRLFVQGSAIRGKELEDAAETGRSSPLASAVE